MDADKPPGDADALCKYDRYAAHRNSPSCAGCHDQMDPIGFGLENYNIAGQWRDTDDGLPSCTIEGVGELNPYGSFSGPAELGELLVDEEHGILEGCVVKQFFSYAIGRAITGNEDQAVEALTGEFVGAGHRLDELIIAYIRSDAFGLRLEPGASP